MVDVNVVLTHAPKNWSGTGQMYGTSDSIGQTPAARMHKRDVGHRCAGPAASSGQCCMHKELFWS